MKKIIYSAVISLLCLLCFTGCWRPDPLPDIEIPIENSYNVSFNLNGYYGINPPQAVQVNFDTIVNEPCTPIRIGYTFSGWHKDVEGTMPWSFVSDIVTSNMTLYAKWSKDTYTVSFNLAGGVGITPSSQQLNLLDRVSAPSEQPVKDGYIFAGWWKGTDEDNYSQEWNFAADIATESMTLYAGWGTMESNENYSFIELNNAIKLLGGINLDTTEDILTLPSFINSKPVISIAKEAFKNTDDFFNIVLPTQLVTLNEKAFYRSLSVRNLTIPNTVTSIGVSAFEGCNYLFSLNLGSGVRNIGERAFYQCNDLASNQSGAVTLGSNVLSVDKEAFSIADNAIYNLNISNGLIRIGEAAFRYAKVHQITIPDSVEYIGDYAFSNSEYLTKLDIGKGIKYIGNKAFFGCNHSFFISIDAHFAPELGSSDVFGPSNNRPNLYIKVLSSRQDHYKQADVWKINYSNKITWFILTDSIFYPNRP